MCDYASYQPVPPPRDPAELLAEAERRKKKQSTGTEFQEDYLR